MLSISWSEVPSSRAYKAIFIAGNEPFTQSPVDYTDPCILAKASGIVVNKIHCGDERTGVESMWRDGAGLGDGKFLFID